MKRTYEKPLMHIYKLQHQAHLLQASEIRGHNNPLRWGTPDDDDQ